MASFGDSLRRERELRQISLREISEATKVNHRYLEALEKNDFRHLPGGVFNKGFVRAYAQYIGVDPDRMVLAYLEEERRQSGPVPAEPAPSRKTRTRAFSIRRADRGRLKPLGWVGAGLALTVLAVVAMSLGWLEWPFGKLPRENVVEPPQVAPSFAPTLPTAPGEVSPAGILFRLIRPARGMLRCDKGTRADLSQLAVGDEIVLDCPGGILVDVEDAGALLLEGPGIVAGPIGEDGVAVRGFRVLPGPSEEGSRE
jgi:transcriptional regulator with XRE-family HTH domain